MPWEETQDAVSPERLSQPIKVPTHTHLGHPDLYLKQDLPHAYSPHTAKSEASLNIEPQYALGSQDCLAR